MMNFQFISFLMWFLLGAAKNTLSIAHSDHAFNRENQFCMCVPYWQCKEDYSGLVDDGIDIIDVRIQAEGPCTGDFDVCCQVECGKRMGFNNDMATNRILGEENEADFAEFPWMLGIMENKVYTCGASLIHPQVALTAAHCVAHIGHFVVRAGEWNWEERNEPLEHQDQVVKKVIFHPFYHQPSLRNDLALLVLASAFKLTPNIGLTCLPPQNRQFDRNDCIATGWGKNSFRNGRYQSILKKVQLPMVPKQTCLKSLQVARLGPFFNLHKSFLCAGGEAHKDTCKGDGGGPLICPIDNQPGRYEQVGIVSWGLTCGIVNTPGVYVNVGLFRDWIDSTLQLLDLNINVYKY